jgi:hypothetical protein
MYIKKETKKQNDVQEQFALDNLEQNSLYKTSSRATQSQNQTLDRSRKLSTLKETFSFSFQ